MPYFKLTGKPVSKELTEVLMNLQSNLYVPIEDIENTPEIKLARSCINNSIATDKLAGREELQEYVLEQLQKRGSAVIDSDGSVQYNGFINKNARLDIVIGLPGAGKSSALTDIISNEFHSQIIDNDEAKKLIPEYNDGWGASVVHKEAQNISERQLQLSLLNRENIVLPKVGSNPEKLNKIILAAKKLNYEVNVHYVDLAREKALGRMLNRFVEEGRFLDPQLIEKYHNNIDGNKIAKSYEVLKKGGNVDGYSRWDNDVKKRERPILIEAECTGEFIRNARSSEHLSTDNIRNDGRDGNTRGGCIPGFYGKSGIMEVIDKQGGNAKNQEDSRRSGTGAKRAESSVIRKLKQYKAEADKKNNTTTDRTISKGDRKRQPER
ncbi:MAG: zeta toxin family protein [Lachnospiraceae bacterium]|nr:zeta toxin family protein [Lachnospiraceae bacterium]